ncbi:hypothetical protein KIH21_02795 [Lacticaseibacillus paracasei subsp. paracasei]|nr:hypothetical protein KIH21_02795 [Lacticaseibacillus paracasei subsp. paracasei]
MSKKIIVVGGVAGGASVAARARRLDESAKLSCMKKAQMYPFPIVHYHITYQV